MERAPESMDNGFPWQGIDRLSKEYDFSGLLRQ